jgi:hypothetical protein
MNDKLKMHCSLGVGISIICLSFVFLRSVSGEELSYGMNGEEWVLFDRAGEWGKTFKLVTVRSFHEGYMAGATLCCGDNIREKMQEELYAKTSYEHLVSALDEFYSNHRNRKILIFGAMKIVSMEMRGVSKEEIDLRLRRYRQKSRDLFK